jgi:uncharacterized membrane protein
MTWPPWFTSLGPPLFFWVMLAAMIAAFGLAIVVAVRRRTGWALLGVVLGVVIGIVIWYFGNTGAFCVALPGSACA